MAAELGPAWGSEAEGPGRLPGEFAAETGTGGGLAAGARDRGAAARPAGLVVAGPEGTMGGTAAGAAEAGKGEWPAAGGGGGLGVALAVAEAGRKGASAADAARLLAEAESLLAARGVGLAGGATAGKGPGGAGPACAEAVVGPAGTGSQKVPGESSAVAASVGHPELLPADRLKGAAEGERRSGAPMADAAAADRAGLEAGSAWLQERQLGLWPGGAGSDDSRGAQSTQASC